MALRSEGTDGPVQCCEQPLRRLGLNRLAVVSKVLMQIRVGNACMKWQLWVWNRMLPLRSAPPIASDRPRTCLGPAVEAMGDHSAVQSNRTHKRKNDCAFLPYPSIDFVSHHQFRENYSIVLRVFSTPP